MRSILKVPRSRFGFPFLATTPANALRFPVKIETSKPALRGVGCKPVGLPFPNFATTRARCATGVPLNADCPFQVRRIKLTSRRDAIDFPSLQEPQVLIEPQIRTKQLAQLCRRVGTALQAGMDVRGVMKREADRGPASQRAVIRHVHQAVDRGDALADALTDCGKFFPPLVVAMVSVGEATGKVAESFLRLADHYERGLGLRRMFLAGITWPVIQLVAVIAIVGFLIWIVGVIGSVVGETTDVLGFGLTGTSGLLIYLAMVGSIVGVLALVIWSASRGARWTRPPVALMYMTPVLGRALRTLALARCAWTLSMTLDTAMDAKRAVRLALASTAVDHYARHADRVGQSIQEGADIATSLLRTHVFPDDFLDALEVGEQSGRAAESMAALAQQYEQQARAAFTALTVVAGFAVWCTVAAIIIAIIFRLAFFYINMINRAASGEF